MKTGTDACIWNVYLYLLANNIKYVVMNGYKSLHKAEETIRYYENISIFNSPKIYICFIIA